MDQDKKIIPYLQVAQKALVVCDELEKTIDTLWSLFGDEFEMLRELKTIQQQKNQFDSLPF